MDDLPGNSNKAKRVAPEPKKVKRVVESSVTQRKKPLGARLKETFIGGEARSVWHYVWDEIIVQAAKEMLADAMSTGVERTLFGEVRSAGRRGGGRSQSGPYVGYSRFATQPTQRREEANRQLSRRARSRHDFDEIIIDSRAEAQEVLDQMYLILEKYELVTVGDLYELAGITSDWTNDDFGWYDLRGAGISRVRNGGYLLDLPRPEPVDK